MDDQTELLKMALVGYQAQRATLEGTIANLKELIARKTVGRALADIPVEGQWGITLDKTASRRLAALRRGEASPRKRKGMSKAGREAIAAAQRKRWRKFHKRRAA